CQECQVAALILHPAFRREWGRGAAESRNQWPLRRGHPMAAFDHILVLFSFVFALALTHLLSRVGALLLARRRVRFSALHTLVMLNAVGWVYANWLLLWDLHGIRNWDIVSITIWFAFAISNYFICVAAAPDVEPAGPIDMEQFYWDNRGLFYVLMLI